MRRILFTILAITYLAATTGATLHRHFCMGRLAGTGLWKQDAPTCGICGMEKSKDGDNGCCSDTQEELKISIDQQSFAGLVFHFEQPFTLILSDVTEFQPVAFTILRDKVPHVSHAPPRSPQQPPYLLHRNFRI